MIKWLLSKIFKRKYFKSVDWSNKEDFSCEVHGFTDRDHILHITKVKYF